VIVLDTNVISEALSPSPSPAVMGWLDRQEPSSLRLTAVTVTELAYGIALLADGARRTALASAWQGLLESWADRVIEIGVSEAEAAGVLLATRRRHGRPITLADAMIAAACITRDCPIATRNTRDFTGLGLELIDPWQSGPA
jgi:predicted nucleic acid-binding protein